MTGSDLPSVQGVSIPDSRLGRAITEFVRDTENELLFNHSIRVYFFGAIAGRERSKAHSMGPPRFRKTLLRVFRRRMRKRQGAPFLAQAANRFRPLGQGAARLCPVTHAGFVGPFGKVRSRLPVRAAGPVGAHRTLIPPNRHCPERKLGIALDRSGHEAIRPANLCDRPVRVENEEREIAD